MEQAEKLEFLDMQFKSGEPAFIVLCQSREAKA